MRHFIAVAFLFALPTLALASPPSGPGPEQLLERVKERWPEKYEHLMGLRQTDPDLFHQHMQKLHHHMMKAEQYPEMTDQVEEMHDLQKQFYAEVKAFKEAKGKEREAIRKELMRMAGEIFEARQALRLLRLERAKERIEELEKDIEDRVDNRTELIEEFVDEATGEKLDGL